ncbi:MAG: DUF4173 domain-containing protein [Acidimicrobiales bacterium]
MTLTQPTLDRPTSERTDAWRHRGRRVALAVVGLGLAVDLTLHRSVDGRAGTMLSVAAATVLLIGARVRRPAVITVALLAPAFGIWLSLRESPWLLALDVVAIMGLLLVSAGFNQGGDPLHITFVDLARRGLSGLGAVVRAPIEVLSAIVAVGAAQSDGRHRHIWRAATRGFALAAPITLAAGILLASADGVFASLVHVPIDGGDLFVHTAALGMGVTAGLALIAHAYSPPPPSKASRLPALGALELTMVLGALVGLYAMFAVAQAVALTRGSDYVQRTTGLTYAEYARRGYFQLLAVAALTVMVLLAVRPYARRAGLLGHRALVLLGETAIALTLVIIGAAVHRLNVYDDAFGLTMLRLSCIVFAYWLAAVFVLVAVAYVSGSPRQWLAPAVVASALVTLFVWNAVNPEAIVARHNVMQASSTVRFDPEYLASLSDDAVPTLVENLSRLPANERVALTRALCREQNDTQRGFWSANQSHSGARRALQKVC